VAVLAKYQVLVTEYSSKFFAHNHRKTHKRNHNVGQLSIKLIYSKAIALRVSKANMMTVISFFGLWHENGGSKGFNLLRSLASMN
jgi:hypothetical protein